jgi:hypothetical protein
MLDTMGIVEPFFSPQKIAEQARCERCTSPLYALYIDAGFGFALALRVWQKEQRKHWLLQVILSR